MVPVGLGNGLSSSPWQGIWILSGVLATRPPPLPPPLPPSTFSITLPTEISYNKQQPKNNNVEIDFFSDGCFPMETDWLPDFSDSCLGYKEDETRDPLLSGKPPKNNNIMDFEKDFWDFWRF